MNHTETSFRKRSAVTRPEIWADGGQRPKFDVRAFAEVGLALTRKGLAPLLKRSSEATARFGARVADGFLCIPEERLGRTGQYLPSHRRVARWISGSADILRQAARTAQPPVTDDGAAISSYDDVLAVQRAATDVMPRRPDGTAPDGGASQASVTADTAPQADQLPMEGPLFAADSVGPAEEPVEDGDALRAIRSVLAEEEAMGPVPDSTAKSAVKKSAKPKKSAPRPERTGPTWFGTLFTALTGRVLGWALTGLALPYGLTKAGLAHLNGADLREMADEL